MKIAEWFNFDSTLAGKEVGVEVEAEATRLPSGVSYWNDTTDGSLRGNSMEYNLKAPAERQTAIDRVMQLYIEFDKLGGINDSDNCGVHVHLNMRPYEMEDVFKVAILYLILEPLLMHWCGDKREGNLFCMRAQDAEYLIYSLIKDKKAGTFGNVLDPETYKYASINFATLQKYGSLEFRGLGTPQRAERVVQWIRFLLAIMDYGLAADDTGEFFYTCSKSGVGTLLTNVMGEMAPMLKFKGWESGMMEAVRRIQTLSFTPMGKVKKKEPVGPMGIFDVRRFLPGGRPPTATADFLEQARRELLRQDQTFSDLPPQIIPSGREPLPEDVSPDDFPGEFDDVADLNEEDDA